MKQLLGRLHAWLSSSPSLVDLAVKVRNQANAIVATHFSRLSVSTDPAVNGENRLVEFVASQAENFIDVGANEGEWSAHFLAHSRAKVPALILSQMRNVLLVYSSAFHRIRKL